MLQLKYKIKKVVNKPKAFILTTALVMLFVSNFFPKDTSWHKYINMFLRNLVEYDYIIAIIALLFILVAIAFKNWYTYINAIIKPLSIIVYIEFLAFIYTERTLLNHYNLIVFAFICLLICILNIFEIEYTLKASKSNDYEPKKNYDDLFETRKPQLEQMISLIKSPESKSISICLSGEWGSGKTTFINAVQDRLKEENNYFFINVNALELDTFKSLFNYFFNCLKAECSQRNAYIGISSEFYDFMSSSIGVLVNNDSVNNLSCIFHRKNKDYRDEKDKLEELLNQVFNDDKIVVIIDDLDRCTEEKQKDFLFFIKEIASFMNCVGIFMVDYTELLAKHTDLNEKFFDKFFNYKFNLVDVSYDDILKYNDNKSQLLIECTNTSLNLSISFKEIINSSITSISRLEDTKNKQKSVNSTNQKNYYEFIINKLSNPRTVIYIYKTARLYIDSINKYLKSYEGTQELNEYFNQINITKLIPILSFIKVCIPHIYDDINKHGMKYVIKNQVLIFSTDTFLIQTSAFLELTENVWWKTMLLEPGCFDYNTNKTISFTDKLIKDPENLKMIVNKFADNEDEVLHYLKNQEFGKIPAQHVDVFELVCTKYSFEDTIKGNEYVKLIFEWLKQDLDSKNVTINDVLVILNSGTYNYQSHWAKLNIFTIFFKTFNQKIPKSNNGYNALMTLNIRVLDCLLKNLNPILSYKFDSELINTAINETSPGNYIIANIKIFVSKLYDSNNSKLIDSNNSKPLLSLKYLIKECETKLKTATFNQYDDVKSLIDLANSSYGEIDKLIKIEKKFNQPSDISDYDINNLNINNLQDYIDHLRKTVNNYDSHTIELLHNFINKLHKEKLFDQELINTTNYLITNYNKNSKVSVNDLRIKLFKIQEELQAIEPKIIEYQIN